MRRLAAVRGIDLHVVYGQPSPAERGKRDTGELSWAEFSANWYLPIKEKKDLCWQRIPQGLRDSDLIIFMQENRLLSNYYWMLKRRLGGPKIAFWGHGKDFQSNAPGGLRERFKEAMLTKVDWWFAYTSMTVEVLRRAGFPPERVTCLNNSMDTAGLRKDAAHVSGEHIETLRRQLELPAGGPVGLFCGSLYPDKRLELLIAACDLVVERHPEFRLVVIGDGASRGFLVEAFESRPWAKWVGIQRGVDKAAYFRLARFVLNPGLVGLHVLDAFAMGLPMITTANAKHSPEIAYMQDGVNGVICGDSPKAYADAVTNLIEDSALYQRIASGALAAGVEYSVERMAENFIDGISACVKGEAI